MTISAANSVILRREGFTDNELWALSQAVDPAGKPQPVVDISSPFWLHLRQTRLELVAGLSRDWASVGWGEVTGDQIDSMINSFYKPGGEYNDIWSWLKVEYRRKKKPKELIL